MADPYLVYWDTSIWLVYFNPRKDTEDTRIPVARQLMEKIQNGTHIVVVPDLVKMEIIGVLRQRVIESQEYRGNDDKVKKEIEKEANKEVEEALGFIRDLSYANKALLINSNISTSELHGKALDILHNFVFGEIEPMRKKCKCPTCGVVKSPVKYNLRYPAHYDLQHAIIATTPLPKNYTIKKIITFDRAFSQLRELKEFKGIIEIEIPIPA
jgi:predicted nucleic acid-binding protein